MTQEIIRAVAEKVMGWVIAIHNTTEYWVNAGDFDVEQVKANWNPLTNLNHAFMVVEKMREPESGGWKFRMDSEDPSEYSANFWKEIPSRIGYGYEEINYDGVGEIGTAICLAALKAKGIDEL